MPHIPLSQELPGIVGLLAFRPETAKPLCELAEVLLRGPSTLTPGEREIIASYVSHRNECHFCHTSHGAAAAAHLGDSLDLVDDIKAGLARTSISPKARALLVVAERVQRGGRSVSDADVERARAAGASDIEIHDTVLIAAAFCMYNRYVDGLATSAPHEKEAYREMGTRLAEVGYVASLPQPVVP